MVMLELWWLLTLMDLQVQKQYHSQSARPVNRKDSSSFSLLLTLPNLGQSLSSALGQQRVCQLLVKWPDSLGLMALII
jgi:hypothetical protein